MSDTTTADAWRNILRGRVATAAVFSGVRPKSFSFNFIVSKLATMYGEGTEPTDADLEAALQRLQKELPTHFMGGDDTPQTRETAEQLLDRANRDYLDKRPSSERKNAAPAKKVMTDKDRAFLTTPELRLAWANQKAGG
jgi:hypothetical protein